jgi:hypothetical protein
LLFATALAFCDYDDLQKARKKLLSVHTFPKYLTAGFKKLDEVNFMSSSHVASLWVFSINSGGEDER